MLSVKKRRAFYEEFIGQKREVLWEDVEKEGMMEGFTDNYVRVTASYHPDLSNTLQWIKLGRINEWGTMETDTLDSQEKGTTVMRVSQ